MPAVSIRISLRPSTSIGVSIASRVVPATSETITRSRPRNALTSEDLPTFGRPMTASRTTSSSSRRLVAVGEQLDEPVEQVARAEPLGGGDGQRLAEPEAVEVVGERQVARAVDLVRGDDDRHVAAAQDVGDLLSRPGACPARASTTNSATWASASAARAWSWMRDGQRILVVEVDAAGVDQRERALPFQSVASSLRSRVTPGRSWTTASRTA